QELIITLYAYIIVYSICLICSQGSQLAYRYSATNKCDAQVPKKWCIFRYIVTLTTSSFVLIHVGITIQHSLSTFLFGVRVQKIASRISILFSFFYPLSYGVLAYYKDEMEGRIAYCSGFTEKSEGILMFNLYLILVLDIANTVISILLWKYNKKKILTVESYDLSRSFHRRQNLYAMKQILPIATLHSVFYVIFFLTVFFSQSLRSNMSPAWYMFTSVVANAVPYYSLLCPLIFLLLIRRGRFKRVSHVHTMVNPVRKVDEVGYSKL
ncbi:hypothetical protein PFISCL1PPCAC_2492, partial [Pristionchus fissidentatus]